MEGMSPRLPPVLLPLETIAPTAARISPPLSAVTAQSGPRTRCRTSFSSRISGRVIYKIPRTSPTFQFFFGESARVLWHSTQLSFSTRAMA